MSLQKRSPLMARTEADQVRTCEVDFTSPRLIGVGFLTFDASFKHTINDFLGSVMIPSQTSPVA